MASGEEREVRCQMKAAVVYESIFGNTMQIAEAVARGLSARFEVSAAEVSAAGRAANSVDLLVIGGPTHAFGMSRGSSRKGALEQAAKIGVRPVSQGEGIRDWLKRLPKTHEPALAASFDTAFKKGRWLPTGSAASSAASQLKKKGFKSVCEPEQFYVTDTEGPLADGELERAEEWGRLLGETAATVLPPEVAVAARA